MTVVITDTILDVFGHPDNTPWHFSSVLHDAGGFMVSAKSEPVYPVNGVLTVELEPGIAKAINAGTTYLFTVPGTDSRLWPLIQAAVALPPGTPADVLAAAIVAYFEAHPLESAGLTEVVQDTSPQLGGDFDLNGHLVGAANAADLAKLHATGALSGSNTGDQDLSGYATLSGVASSISSAVTTAENRDNHSGTQSADTIVDGLTNRVYTAAEKTRLAGTSGSNTGDQDLSGLVPATRTVNGVALTSNVTLTQDSVGDGSTNKQYSAADKTRLASTSGTNTGDQDLSSFVANTRTVNGHALSANVSLTQDDVGDGTTNKAYTATEKTRLAGTSGTNTGDQTSVTGNAGTATVLATSRNIAGVAFNGSADITLGTSSVSNSTLVLRTGAANIQANNFLPNITSTTTSGGTSAMTNTSANTQLLTGVTTHTMVLPTTNVAAGWPYKFINTSTGAVTINASNGSLVKTLAAGASTEITSLQATPTTPTHWYAT